MAKASAMIGPLSAKRHWEQEVNLGPAIMKMTKAKSSKPSTRGRTKLLARHESPTTIRLVPARLSLKKILVPIDFSEESMKALHYALQFAEQFGARLILAHVVEPVIVPAELGYTALEMPIVNPTNMAKLARKRLDALMEKVVKPPLTGQSLVRIGSPFNEITAVAKEQKADLIIIATHGYTGLKHLFLGSTAERVVRHAPCPVLTVRQHEREFVRRNRR